jgi:hypothetical protein
MSTTIGSVPSDTRLYDEKQSADGWTSEDTPHDIATVMIGKFSSDKAEKAARAILAEREANFGDAERHRVRRGAQSAVCSRRRGSGCIMSIGRIPFVGIVETQAAVCRCGRHVRPDDFERIGEVVRVICQGCFADLIAIQIPDNEEADTDA